MAELEKLSATEVQEAGLTDWRQILNRLKARYSTVDLPAGVELTHRIGRLAAEADAHPEITLTPGSVVLALSTPQARGIAGRDLELAARITTVAADLGATADPAGLTQVELGLDTSRDDHLAPFYATLLGSTVQGGEPVDPSGQVPTIWWQNPDASDSGSALPAQDFQQRWHLDVWVAHDDAERRLQAVLDAGGRLVSAENAPSYRVVEDAAGNRSCICTPSGR
ncbi:4a-hydroxytetrahydrobiopterin dehydratase [Jatrophihabitans sp. YIM 134969]